MNRKKIDVYDNLTEIVKELKEGVLLTAKADDQVNSMTISWGMLRRPTRNCHPPL